MKPAMIIEETRRLRVAEYEIPSEIRLDEGRLFWHPVKEWRKVKPTGEVFNQFLEFADLRVPDAAILRFARKWGVLWLCSEHLEPLTLGNVEHWKCEPLEYGNSPQGEPLSEWRRWSRLAGAIVRICEKHEDGETAATEDWQILWDDRWFVKGDRETWTQNRRWKYWNQHELYIEKAHMISAINRWLQIGDVRPQLVPSETEPYLTLGTSGLLGVLAVGLLQVAGNHVIAGCSGCRRFYTPNIKPKAGHPRYCQDCRDAGIPVARAKLRQQIGASKRRSHKPQRKTKRADSAPKR